MTTQRTSTTTRRAATLCALLFALLAESVVVNGQALPSFMGRGTAIIDGVLSPGEWDFSENMFLEVGTPDGKKPATIFVMNDAHNLYLALRFQRALLDPESTLIFRFDNDNDGISEDGEDVILFNQQYGGFQDMHLITGWPCPRSAPAPCAVLDTEYGGTNDGSGAVRNDGTYTVYEMSHPLDSSDYLHDLSLSPGQHVGFNMVMRIIDPNGQYPDGYTFLDGVIQIYYPIHHPISDAGPDKMVSIGESITLDGSGSTPATGLTYRWTPIGPYVALLDADSARAQFTPLNVETYIFRLVVTDAMGYTAFDDVQITAVENKLDGVYISKTFGRYLNPGKVDLPENDISRGFQLAAKYGKDIYIESGEYFATSTLDVTNGVSVYGGFIIKEEAGHLFWFKDPDSRSVIHGQTTAMRISDVIDQTAITGLAIYSADGAETAAFGENSIAILVQNSNEKLRIYYNIIQAGNGGKGAQGIDGSGGNPGEDGKLHPTACVASPGGRGGIITGSTRGASGGSSAGGSGGSTGCRYFVHSQSGSGDGGGAGGRSFLGKGDVSRTYYFGENGGYGRSGSTARPGGLGGSGAGEFIGGSWRGAQGQDGNTGEHGAGGGGGGATSYIFAAIFLAGGSGGGAGIGGNGGKGGYAGGASIGILFSNSSATFIGNSVSTGNGGDGGRGGRPGCGGHGGKGAPGWLKDSRDVIRDLPATSQSGSGGPGGYGGNGSGGGGGQGGLSWPWVLNNSNPTLLFNRASLGSPGRGGWRGEKICPTGENVPGGGGAPGPEFKDDENISWPDPIVVNPSGQPSTIIPVRSGGASATFGIQWSGSDIALALTSPSGRKYSREILGSDFIHDVGGTYEVYTILNPEPGDWIIELTGIEVPPQGEQVQLQYSLTLANLAPTADAGHDRIIEATGSHTMVVVDGSRSIDPDSDPLRFEWWNESNQLVGTSSRLGLPLPLGDHTLILKVNDGRGGTSSDSVVIHLVDTTPPDLQFTQEAIDVILPQLAGAVVDLSNVASATDTVSAIVKITNDAPTLFQPGVTIVHFTATDMSGNAVTRPFSVHVGYAFSGFLPPLERGPASFKPGSTIPVKFTLKAADGSFVKTERATLEMFKVAIADTPPIAEKMVVEPNAGGSGNYFRYDPTTNQYVYNLRTAGYSPGTYRIYVALGDETVQFVEIVLRY